MNDPNNLPALLACPFCGGEAGFAYPYGNYLTEHGTFLGGVWIICGGCGVELGRGGWDSMEEDNGIYESFQEAADCWNRRTP